jgi:hypothetical protein
MFALIHGGNAWCVIISTITAFIFATLLALLLGPLVLARPVAEAGWEPMHGVLMLGGIAALVAYVSSLHPLQCGVLGMFAIAAVFLGLRYEMPASAAFTMFVGSSVMLLPASLLIRFPGLRARKPPEKPDTRWKRTPGKHGSTLHRVL